MLGVGDRPVLASCVDPRRNPHDPSVIHSMAQCVHAPAVRRARRRRRTCTAARREGEPSEHGRDSACGGRISQDCGAPRDLQAEAHAGLAQDGQLPPPAPARNVVSSNNVQALDDTGQGSTTASGWQVSGTAVGGTIEVPLDLAITAIGPSRDAVAISVTGSRP